MRFDFSTSSNFIRNGVISCSRSVTIILVSFFLLARRSFVFASSFDNKFADLLWDSSRVSAPSLEEILEFKACFFLFWSDDFSMTASLSSKINYIIILFDSPHKESSLWRRYFFVAKLSVATIIVSRLEEESDSLFPSMYSLSFSEKKLSLFSKSCFTEAT